MFQSSCLVLSNKFVYTTIRLMIIFYMMYTTNEIDLDSKMMTIRLIVYVDLTALMMQVRVSMMMMTMTAMTGVGDGRRDHDCGENPIGRCSQPMSWSLLL